MASARPVVRRGLGFRCRRCRRIALVQAEWTSRQPVTVECSHCGEAYVLAADRDRAGSDSLYRERIRAFGAARGLDPATATSVLEEIVTLEEARAFRHSRQEPPTPAAKKAPRKRLRLVAAAAGIFLCSVLLAMRHREEKPAPAPAAAAPEMPVEQAPASEPAPPPVPPVRESPVVSWKDDEGRVTELSGPDPQSVLDSYCLQDGASHAIAVAPAVPPTPGIRMGVLRRDDDPTKEFAITIRRDPRTGQWFTGDRQRPVRPLVLAASVTRPAPAASE